MKFRLCAVLLVVCNGGCQAQFANAKDRRIAAEVIEDATGTLVKWGSNHGNTMQILFSLVALTHGGRFTHAMLLIHTLKVTSGDLLKEAFGEVIKAYRAMRNEARKHTPDFETAKKEIQEKTVQAANVNARITKAKASRDAGEISKQEFDKIEAEAKAEMILIVQEKDKLRPAVSSLAAVVAAVDANSLRKVGTALYTALLSSMATASSRTAATAAIGFNIGRQVAMTLRGFVLPIMRVIRKIFDYEMDILPHNFAKTIRAMVTITATVGGIFVAHKLQAIALTIATCYFAAGALVTTTAHILQDSSSTLKRFIRDESPVFSFLHIVIATLASVAQLKGLIPLPLPLKILFFPLNILETYLRAISWRPAIRGIF